MGNMDIFVGMDSFFEPGKAQEDPLEVLKQATINNSYAFILLTFSHMMECGDVRLEAPQGSHASESVVASMNRSLPTTLRCIANTFLKK